MNGLGSSLALASMPSCQRSASWLNPEMNSKSTAGRRSRMRAQATSPLMHGLVARQRTPHGVRDRRDVVGVDEVKPGVPDQLRMVVAEDAVLRVTRVLEHPVGADLEDHVAGVLNQRAEPLLAPRQLVVQASFLGAVAGHHQGTNDAGTLAHRGKAQGEGAGVEVRRGRGSQREHRTERRKGRDVHGKQRKPSKERVGRGRPPRGAPGTDVAALISRC